MKHSLIFLVLCCFMSAAAMAQKDSTLLSPSQMEDRMAAGDMQLVDVRTREEYKSGHLKNSLLADWKKRDEFARRVKKLDNTKPVYLYCAAGGRSHAAAEWMRSNGFTQVYELDGGIEKWKEENKPLEK